MHKRWLVGNTVSKHRYRYFKTRKGAIKQAQKYHDPSVKVIDTTCTSYYIAEEWLG